MLRFRLTPPPPAASRLETNGIVMVSKFCIVEAQQEPPHDEKTEEQIGGMMLS